MTTLQKIVMGALVLAIIFLSVFSTIQMGYAKKERDKAIVAQYMADESAEKAKVAVEEAVKQKTVADIERIKRELLEAELVACKGKK